MVPSALDCHMWEKGCNPRPEVDTIPRDWREVEEGEGFSIWVEMVKVLG